MIPGYIAKHGISMKDFEGQEYRSFAEFFGRKLDSLSCVMEPDVLISPCDSLLSVFPITADMNIPMKGSHYRLCDLIPDERVASSLTGGVCLVFRLRPIDYHHFCAFDDATIEKANFIPGLLHSVQPIACEKLPVFRLNRRWWSLLHTAHFGDVVQLEVGAMMVGGVHFVKESGEFRRGDDFGNFELAGSTIVLLLPAAVRERLAFDAKFVGAFNGEKEAPVFIGERIGVLTDAKEDAAFLK